MGADPRETEFRLPTRQELRGFLPYVAAGVLYVAIALIEVDFMFSVLVAIAYLLVVVWLLPLAVRRFL